MFIILLSISINDFRFFIIIFNLTPPKLKFWFHHYICIYISTLLSEGLIEPTASPWSCEAFYVNKHAEQVPSRLVPTGEKDSDPDNDDELDQEIQKPRVCVLVLLGLIYI